MPNVRNHTEIKSEELLKAQVYEALADGNAFIFIDTIDPVGTLGKAVYERMGKVFNETKKHEPYLGGELCQDVAVYLSTESKFDFADNGKRVDDSWLSSKMPHVDAALSVCKSLIDYHIPFGVIGKRNLGELSRHKILVLLNVLMIDEEEADSEFHEKFVLDYQFRILKHCGLNAYGCCELYANKFDMLKRKVPRL